MRGGLYLASHPGGYTALLTPRQRSATDCGTRPRRVYVHFTLLSMGPTRLPRPLPYHVSLGSGVWRGHGAAYDQVPEARNFIEPLPRTCRGVRGSTPPRHRSCRARPCSGRRRPCPLPRPHRCRPVFWTSPPPLAFPSPETGRLRYSGLAPMRSASAARVSKYGSSSPVSARLTNAEIPLSSSQRSFGRAS